MCDLAQSPCPSVHWPMQQFSSPQQDPAGRAGWLTWHREGAPRLRVTLADPPRSGEPEGTGGGEDRATPDIVLTGKHRTTSPPKVKGVGEGNRAKVLERNVLIHCLL